MPAVASGVVLALAPIASGAFAPKLTATPAASGGVTIAYSQLSSEDGAAAIALYAPAGSGAGLPATPGATIGHATVNGIAADVGGSTVRLDGTVKVAAATTPLVGGAAATVGDAARACTGSDSSFALWVVTLTGFAQRLDVALALQRVAAGPLAGHVAVFVCPQPADVPSGTAGRAPLGMKLVRLTLTLPKAFAAPAGISVWHVRATPYTPRSATQNGAAAVEAEASYGLPQALTVVATPQSGSRRVRVSGRLTLAGKGVAARTVDILAGGRKVTTAKTNGSGAFATTVAIGSPSTKLAAKAVVPARYLPSCTQPAFAPIPCTTSILAGFTARSAAVRVAT